MKKLVVAFVLGFLTAMGVAQVNGLNANPLHKES